MAVSSSPVPTQVVVQGALCGVDPGALLAEMERAVAAVEASVAVAQKACDDLAFWTPSDTKRMCATNVAQTKKYAAQLRASLETYRRTPPTPEQVQRFLDLAKAASDQRVWNEAAQLYNTGNLVTTVGSDTVKDIPVVAGKVVDTAGDAVNKVATTLVTSLGVPLLMLGGVAAAILYMARRSGATIDTKFVKINANGNGVGGLGRSRRRRRRRGR